MSSNYSVENEAKHIILNILEVVKKSQYLKVGEQPIGQVHITPYDILDIIMPSD